MTNSICDILPPNGRYKQCYKFNLSSMARKCIERNFFNGNIDNKNALGVKEKYISKLETDLLY